MPLGITTSLTFTNRINKSEDRQRRSACCPGAIPTLKDEVVVYTAHHDHLGIGEPDKSGDKIYNGAVDNASGCAQVLAIAKAFAALPQRPRRSVLIAVRGGRGAGPAGLAVPARPTSRCRAGRIAANINFDGGNVLGRTRDVT